MSWLRRWGSLNVARLGPRRVARNGGDRPGKLCSEVSSADVEVESAE